MRYLGLLRTRGAPLCIARQDSLEEWEGWGHDGGGEALVTTVLSGSGARFALVRPSSDRVAVFASRDGFALLEDPYGTGEYDVGNALFAIESLELEPDVMRLARFGGRVAVFVAEMPGEAVPVDGSGTLAASGLAEAAWLDLTEGYWTASRFTFEDDDQSIRGVWFEAVEESAP
jgi:hypothetical protein